MRGSRLTLGFLTVGFWTLASRVLGFVREILLTSLVGPGPVMDAFVVAFRLPNMFRRFFAEGAFNAAFVPMFSKKFEGGDDAERFANQTLNVLGLTVLALVGLGMVAMPAFVWLTAHGTYGDERFDLAVGYGYVVFPYIFFMSLAALFSGVLNSVGRFAAAAAAPVLLNIFTCGAMILGAVVGGNVIIWLIWTIPVAGVAQLSLVWIATERAGIRLRPSMPQWGPEMSNLVRIAIPAALASGVVQVNLLVGQFVASSTEKAMSWLFVADRLYQLPLGVVGIAVGIVLLPELSRRLRAQDDEGARNAYSRAGEFAMMLTVPSAVAFMVIPLPLVSVLYERGQTTSDDIAAIAVAVSIYGVGLPAFVLQKLLQPLYFAREDTRSPFRYAVVAMVVNALLAFGLQPWMGWLSAAIAATVSAWTMIGLLMWGARGYGLVARFDARFRSRAWRIIAASAMMGVALWFTALSAAGALHTPGWRYLALLCLIIFGAVVYFGVGQLIGAFRLSDLRKSLRRG
jgi:putative peptidoglycan lipid II flippase